MNMTAESAGPSPGTASLRAWWSWQSVQDWIVAANWRSSVSAGIPPSIHSHRLGQPFARHENRILEIVLVVVRPAAGHAESELGIQPAGRIVRHPHLERHHLGALAGGLPHCLAQDPLAEAASAQTRADRQRAHVGFLD